MRQMFVTIGIYMFIQRLSRNDTSRICVKEEIQNTFHLQLDYVRHSCVTHYVNNKKQPLGTYR